MRKKHTSRRTFFIGISVLLMCVLSVAAGITLSQINLDNRPRAAGKNRETISQQSTSNTFLTTITVQPTIGTKISPFIWGMNMAERGYGSSVEDYTQLLGYGSVGLPKLKSLNIQMLRFPTGCTSTFYDWQTAGLKYKDEKNQEVNTSWLSVDDALRINAELGSQLLFVVNLTQTEHTNSCGKTPLITQTPEQAAQLVTQYKGKIKYYQLGNEPYADQAISKDSYAQTALSFAQAMKAVDPTIHLTASGYPTNDSTDSNLKAWQNSIQNLLKARCGDTPCIDAITDHTYIEAGYLARYPQDQRNYPGISAYYPDLKLAERFASRQSLFGKPLHLTEWNQVCWDDRFPKNTVENGFFAWETLLQAVRSNAFGAEYMHLAVNQNNTDCGITQLGKAEFNPTAEAFRLTSSIANTFKLDSIVNGAEHTMVEGTNCVENDCMGPAQQKYVTVFSSIDTNNSSLILLIANRSATQISKTTISLPQLNAYTYKSFMGSAAEYKAPSYLDTSFGKVKNYYPILKKNNNGQANTLSVELPPVSLTRITIQLSKK